MSNEITLKFIATDEWYPVYSIEKFKTSCSLSSVTEFCLRTKSKVGSTMSILISDEIVQVLRDCPVPQATTETEVGTWLIRFLNGKFNCLQFSQYFAFVSIWRDFQPKLKIQVCRE
jgi:hypothetical protein